MGYPVITRLGLSQFWYRHWYSDSNKNYFLNFKQDIMFTHLLKMYLQYGLTFNNSLFFHELYFNKNSKQIRLNIILKNLKYYRRFYFSNDNLGIEHSYFLRYKTGEYFPLRLWVIKYSGWLILSFNCFKPVKRKISKRKIVKSEYYALSHSLNSHNCKYKYKRFKLIFLLLRYHSIFNNYPYYF